MMQPQDLAAAVAAVRASGMDSDAIVSVSAAVVGLTQLVKWAGLPDGKGPFAVMGIAAFGVFVWAVSREVPFARTMVFSYFTGWIAVSLAAAGIFGFTRASANAVSSIKGPPAGAGANPTT